MSKEIMMQFGSELRDFIEAQNQKLGTNYSIEFVPEGVGSFLIKDAQTDVLRKKEFSYSASKFNFPIDWLDKSFVDRKGKTWKIIGSLYSADKNCFIIQSNGRQSRCSVQYVKSGRFV